MVFQTKLAQLQTRIDQLEKDLEEKTKELVPAAAEKTELQIQIADLEKEKSELQNQNQFPDLEDHNRENQIQATDVPSLERRKKQDSGLEELGGEGQSQARNVKNSDTEYQNVGVADVPSQSQDSDLDNYVKEGQHRVPNVEKRDGRYDVLEALLEKYSKLENQTCNNEEEVQILDHVQQPSTARSDDTFRFSVAGISKLAESVFSHPTYVYGFPWKIEIRPKQDGDAKNLGFYLHCYSHISHRKDLTWSCQASVELRVVSHKKNDSSKTFSHLFCAKHSSRGYHQFMSWDVKDNICHSANWNMTR